MTASRAASCGTMKRTTGGTARMNPASASLIHELRPSIMERRSRLQAAAQSVSAEYLNDLLAEVDAALRRIDEGTFGICEVCHDSIEADCLARTRSCDSAWIISTRSNGGLTSRISSSQPKSNRNSCRRGTLPLEAGGPIFDTSRRGSWEATTAKLFRRPTAGLCFSR